MSVSQSAARNPCYPPVEFDANSDDILRDLVARVPTVSLDFIARTLGVARGTVHRRLANLGLTRNGVAKSGPKTGPVLDAFQSLREEIRAAVREKPTAPPYKPGKLEW